MTIRKILTSLIDHANDTGRPVSRFIPRRPFGRVQDGGITIRANPVMPCEIRLRIVNAPESDMMNEGKTVSPNDLADTICTLEFGAPLADQVVKMISQNIETLAKMSDSFDFHGYTLEVVRVWPGMDA